MAARRGGGGQEGRGSAATAEAGPATTHPRLALTRLAQADLQPEAPTPSPARAAVWQPPIGCTAPASGGRDQLVTAEWPERGAGPRKLPPRRAAR